MIKEIREALAGSHQDYTEGSIGRAVLLLAIPMVLETCMESVFAVVDIYFVSSLGPNAIAAVGLTEAMLTILYAVAIGLSMGASAMVARRIGEKNPDGASIAAVQAIVVVVILSLSIGVFGFLMAPTLLSMFGASADVIAEGSGYTRIMLGANISVMMLFLINAIFRGAGDAAIAMRVLWIANAINIVLDPCLIFGLGPFPKLGVTGAAIATVTGRGIGVLIQLWKLSRGTDRFKIRREHLRINFPVIRSLCRVSGVGVFQSLIGMTSWLGLVRILTSFGSAAVAGYTIGIRIILFALLPSWGLSNAAATMVGQNLGAEKPDRAEKAVWIACKYNFFFLLATGTFFVLRAEWLIGIFTKDSSVTVMAVNCLRIISCGFIFYAYGMVLTQAFNGAGDTTTPTWINVFCFWLWEIPLALILAKYFDFGPPGVFFAITVAFSTLAVVSALLFRRGTWKLRKI